jgi:MinD-like ATPase involved in chromosome partitioning or flagellar assembly
MVLGTLPSDPYVPRAVMQRRPWAELYPRAAATGAIKKLASKILNGNGETRAHRSGFIQRISAYFKVGAET